MNETIRLILLLALAGSAVTMAASAARFWLDEERRLSRYIARALGGPPDAQLIARGRGTAAAFSVSAGQIIVMWNGGAQALLYPFSALVGAELIVDGGTAARVYRGEARKILDQIAGGAQDVTLRLVFDNPRDPEFEMDLWLPADAARRDARSPTDAIREGRNWIARADAILRTPASVVRSEPILPIDDDEEDDAPF